MPYQYFCFHILDFPSESLKKTPVASFLWDFYLLLETHQIMDRLHVNFFKTVFSKIFKTWIGN